MEFADDDCLPLLRLSKRVTSSILRNRPAISPLGPNAGSCTKAMIVFMQVFLLFFSALIGFFVEQF